MAGKTKRKYEAEIQRFNKSLRMPLNTLQSVLPYDYSYDDILSLFKKLYPYEWNIIEQRTTYYASKDRHLKSVHKKTRFKPTEANMYLFGLQEVENILSDTQKRLHRDNFDENARIAKLEELQTIANNRMIKINSKIKKTTYLTQEVEPLYLDIFIGAYHQKSTTLDDKIEIVKELQKYECDISTMFFQKLNDSERNKQIQTIAHEHLKSIKQYGKLRKNFQGKKKEYMSEKTLFDMKPLDLVQRIKNDKVQNKKTFDYFISHSYKDNKKVKEIVKYLNTQNLHAYVDWFADTDFLKRTLSSDYTKVVLKKRIEQSKKVLFLRTENINDDENNFYSKWVEMEINYAKELGKEIECINFIEDAMCEFESYKNSDDIKDLK